MKLIRMHQYVYTRGHTRKLSTPEVLEALREHDVHTVLNLAPAVDPHLQRFAPDYGVVYAHHPLVDGPKVDEEKVEEAVSLVVENLWARRVTVVHCNGGRNRTGLVVGLALTRIQAGSPAEVLEAMRGARPGMLSNTVFERYLLNSGGNR